MVGEVAPVRGSQEDEIGGVTGRDTTGLSAATQDVGCVDGARGQGLCRSQVELRDRERGDQRKALAERAAGIEVGRKSDHRPRVDERATRRHRPVEIERAGREQDGRDVGGCERADAGLAGRLEVVD